MNKNFIEGVNIIMKYLDEECYDFTAEHDVVYFGDSDTVTDEKDRLAT